MKHLFTLLFLSSILLCKAQNPQIDSLRNLIETNQSKQDSIYIQLVLQQSLAFSEISLADSALLAAKRAESLAKKGNYYGLQVKSLQQIGEAYSEKYDYKTGAEYFFKTLRLAEKHKDIAGLAQASKGIAFSYLRGGEGLKGIPWFEKASGYFDQLGQKRYVALCQMSIGSCYHTDSLEVEAEKHYLKALKVSQELEDEFVINMVKSNYAATLMGLHKPLEAVKYSEEVLPFYEAMGNPDYLASEYSNLANYYILAGNDSKATFYGLKALEITEKYKMWGPMKITAQNLSEQFEKKGDFEKANDYLKKSFMAKDSLDVANIKDKTETLELEYEGEKKSLEIENLNTSLENRRLQQYWLASGLFFLAILGFVFFRNNKSLSRKNKQIEEQKDLISELNVGLETKVAERTKELQIALDEVKEAMGKGQTSERKRIASDLHDNLGSVLSAISMNIEALDPKTLTPKEQKLYQNIKNMTSDAYQEVRLISHNLSPKELENEGLVTALERLVSKLNQANKTNFNLKTEKVDLRPAEELNLYAISMEVCNNILKHAEATDATIALSKRENQIHLEIHDNGIGIQHNNKGGNGMQNIRERVESINGKLVVQSDTKNGTLISITL